MNAEQLKRVANSRYAAMRKKDEEIEELRKALAQEVVDSTRLLKTVGEYARDLTEKDKIIERMKSDRRASADQTDRLIAEIARLRARLQSEEN